MNALMNMMITGVEQDLNNSTQKELENLGMNVAIELIGLLSNPNADTDPKLVLKKSQLMILMVLIKERVEKPVLN